MFIVYYLLTNAALFVCWYWIKVAVRAYRRRTSKTVYKFNGRKFVDRYGNELE